MDRLVRKLKRFFSELKRRNVYKVGVTYAVVAFVTLRAARLIFPATTLEGVYDALVVFAVVGFPIALVLAWALELTPEGVRQTGPAEEPAEEGARAQFSTQPDLWVGASVLLLLLLGAWWFSVGGAWPDGSSKESPPDEALPAEGRSVAVLPFEVSGSGTQEWRDGMVTALSLNLDGAAGLRAIADRTVFAAWENQDSARAGTSTEEALKVARTVGARYAIVGSAVQLGTDLRLGAEVFETPTGERLGQVEARGAPDSITALTDRLTRELLGVLLKESEAQAPSVSLESITTSSLPALKTFLDGERLFREGTYEAALEKYKAAVDEDSTFALAYAHLAFAYWFAEGATEHVVKNWRHARARSDRLPSRDQGLVQAIDLWLNKGNAIAAADRLRQLSNNYPDDASIWYSLGEVILHSSVPGGMPEAERAFKHAVELEPGHAPYHLHHVHLGFSFHRDSTLVAERIEAQPDTREKKLFQLARDLIFGPSRRNGQVLARLDTMSVEFGVPFFPIVMATMYPTDGALQEQVLRQIVNREDVQQTPYPALLVGNSLERGQVEEAITDLHTVTNPTEVTCLLARLRSLGSSVPNSVALEYLDPSEMEKETSSERLACAGIYLVDEASPAEIKSLLDRLRARAQKIEDRREGNEARVRAMIEELESYWAWKRGSTEAAQLPPRSIFVRPLGLWPVSWSGIWRGDFYRERGELQEAERWYLGGWWHPVAHERLGQLYEEMGRPEEARAAYRRFIEAWSNADEPLKGRVQEARERLEELGGERTTE